VNNVGELVVDSVHIYARDYSEGLAAVEPELSADKGHENGVKFEKVGFIDKSGNSAISTKFFSAASFRHGLCLVETEKRIGYIDSTGEFIWSSGWVEIGQIDPHHLLPVESDFPLAQSTVGES